MPHRKAGWETSSCARPTRSSSTFHQEPCSPGSGACASTSGTSATERRCAAPYEWMASVSTTRRDAATNGRGCARRSDGVTGSTGATPSPDSSPTSSTSWSGTGAGRLLFRRSRVGGGPRGGPDRVLPERSLLGRSRRTDQSGGHQDLDGDAVGRPRDSPDSEVRLRERGPRLPSVSMAPAGRRSAGIDGVGAGSAASGCRRG